MSAIDQSRINLRTSPEAKAMIKRAAALMGTSVSAFMLQHAYEAARRVIADNDTLLLSQHAFEALVEQLEPPPPPSDAMLLTRSEVRMPCETGIRGSITASTWAIWQHCPTSASPAYEVSCNLQDCLISKRAIVGWVKTVEPILPH